MEKLLIIFLISVLYSCGKKDVPNSSDIRDLHSLNSGEIKIIPKIEIESVEVNQRKISQNSLIEKSFYKAFMDKLKLNSFYYLKKSSSNGTFQKITFDSTPLEDLNFTFNINSTRSICHINLFIKGSNQLTEFNIFENQIIQNSFTIATNLREKELEYRINNYRYCDFEYSYNEYKDLLLKNHYQLNILDEDYESYFIPEGVTLLAVLKALDSNLKINTENKIKVFKGKRNNIRLSPLNKNLSTHHFWILNGLEDESLNQRPLHSQIINLINIPMEDIKKQITKEVYINGKNNTIELPDTQKYILKSMIISGNVAKPKIRKRRVKGREKIKFRIMGHNRSFNRDCYAYRYQDIYNPFSLKTIYPNRKKYINTEKNKIIFPLDEKTFKVGYKTDTCTEKRFKHNGSTKELKLRKIKLKSNYGIGALVKIETIIW